HGGGAGLARRRADGKTRFPSAVGQLPLVQALEVALAELLQGQGRGRRGSERRGLAGGARRLRGRRRPNRGAPPPPRPEEAPTGLLPAEAPPEETPPTAPPGPSP